MNPKPDEQPITFSFPSDVCETCKQVRVHHQHPLKPLGVSMAATCGCTPTIARTTSPEQK